jgi:hypothetical protein
MNKLPFLYAFLMVCCLTSCYEEPEVPLSEYINVNEPEHNDLIVEEESFSDIANVYEMYPTHDEQAMYFLGVDYDVRRIIQLILDEEGEFEGQAIENNSVLGKIDVNGNVLAVSPTAFPVNTFTTLPIEGAGGQERLLALGVSLANVQIMLYDDNLNLMSTAQILDSLNYDRGYLFNVFVDEVDAGGVTCIASGYKDKDFDMPSFEAHPFFVKVHISNGGEITILEYILVTEIGGNWAYGELLKLNDQAVSPYVFCVWSFFKHLKLMRCSKLMRPAGLIRSPPRPTIT